MNKFLIFSITFLISFCLVAKAQPPSHAKWQLAWSDEFNGVNADLDTGWNSFNGGYASTSINCSRWRRNAVEENGVLKLIYKKEATSGGSGSGAWSYNWTAGSIFTKRKFRYGYYECRYKVAGTVGTNNSFWLISSKNRDTSIKTFEIDINEGWYSASATNGRQQVRTNVHNWSDTFTNKNGDLSHPQASVKYNPSPWYNIATQYHVMGLEWNEKELIWYLDGKVIRRVANQQKYGAIANCFDFAPVYLSAATITFDLPQPDSLDGNWMEVDYVRIYEKQPSPVNVTKCAGDSIMLVAYPEIPDATTYRWEVSTQTNGVYNAWTPLNTGPTSVTNIAGFGASYLGVTNDTLIISNTNMLLQNARYRCRLGTARSANATAYPANYTRYSDTALITIYEPLSFSVTYPDSIYFGSSVPITTNINSGFAPYTYSWNGPQSFTDSGWISTIANFQLQHEGTYTIAVADAHGCDAKKTFTLKGKSLNSTPVIVDLPDTLVATAYNPITFQANISGGIGSYKNYKWIGKDSVMSTSKTWLLIQPLKSYEGRYTLFVADSVGYTSSKSFFLKVNKRVQTISFNPIKDTLFVPNANFSVNLSATSSAGLPISFSSGNTILASVTDNVLEVNKKRPDYSVLFKSPVYTKRVRVYSSQSTHFHIREIKIFKPIKGNYPSPLLDVVDSERTGLYNYATKQGVTVNASGSLVNNNATFAPANAIDGLVATSWVSQINGDKFIEVILPDSVEVGGIQFVNGFLSSGVWQGLLNSFSLQYFSDNQWKNIDCSLDITALQSGDENTEPASISQTFCIDNVIGKLSGGVLALNHIQLKVGSINNAGNINLQWQGDDITDVNRWDVELSVDGVNWIVGTHLPQNVNSHLLVYSVYNAFKYVRLVATLNNGRKIYSNIGLIVWAQQAVDFQFTVTNPAQKVLQIFPKKAQSNSYQYVIYDHVGRIGLQGKTNNGLIDLQSLKKGVYYIKVATANSSSVQKFIKL